MSDWTLKDLQGWDDKICEIAESHGLDWYPITYETCDYFEMLGNMSYHGMPTHYGHWSYGKSFEVQRQQYQAGMTGLPYELIINSNPCISYLMKENPLHLQVLIMAHCVGHSDFFKNNRSFSHTRADTVVPRMRNAKKRIQSYIEDPSIGIEAVETVIDAAHALSYQVPRHPTELRDLSEIRNEWQEFNRESVLSGKMSESKYNRIPQEPEYDILGFIGQYARKVEDWERDIIEIIRDEAYYFMPQIRTKTMNEGWACFWHYKILHELELPQKYHIPFLKSHNQVVRPHLGSVNPYHIGFHLFNKIEERFEMDKEKALDAALSQIERSFGKGSIMKLGQDSPVMEIEAVSTGSIGLDVALGIGGLPKGRIIEIYGPESSGKTTLALQVVAEAQKAGGICAFVDAEHALDPSYAKKLGVNLDDLLISCLLYTSDAADE